MSAPEFQGEPMTRREVLLARDAYANGMVRGSACEFVGQINGGMSGLLRAAERAFPLPTVTRPRVVADPECPKHIRWSVSKVTDNVMCEVLEGDFWALAGAGHSAFFPTKGRVKLWADLYAEPTETVTEDEP